VAGDPLPASEVEGNTGRFVSMRIARPPFTPLLPPNGLVGVFFGKPGCQDVHSRVILTPEVMMIRHADSLSLELLLGLLLR